MYSGYGYGSLTELTEFSGHGYGSLTEPTEVPGRYTNVVPVPVPATGYFYKGIPVPRVLYHKRTELNEVPGTGTNVVQNLQKFRVRVIPRVWFCAYPKEHLFTHVQKFRVGTRMLYPYPYPHPGMFKRAYPYPGYCATGVQKLQKFRVRVPMSYRTCRNSGYG